MVRADGRPHRGACTRVFADIVRVGRLIEDWCPIESDLLIEILTRNFSSIKRKLEKPTARHAVRLVYPIPRVKWITRLAKSRNSQLSRRRSPGRCSFEDVFYKLVRLPELLWNPNFSVEPLLIEEKDVPGYAAKIYASDGSALAERGARVIRHGKYTDNIRAFDSAISHDPNDAAARDGKVAALTRLKRYDQALQACYPALAINPDQYSPGRHR